jgi:hypothetical protein
MRAKAKAGVVCYWKEWTTNKGNDVCNYTGSIMIGNRKFLLSVNCDGSGNVITGTSNKNGTSTVFINVLEIASTPVRKRTTGRKGYNRM